MLLKCVIYNIRIERAGRDRQLKIARGHILDNMLTDWCGRIHELHHIESLG
jgi:hypothetical protein